MPNLLSSRPGRLAAFFFLYLTEGLPLGLVATAVATQLRRQNVSAVEIGAFIGAFYLPWAFKWVVGPVIDVVWSRRLGRRRGWILGSQVMMIATLLACTSLELPGQLLALSMVLMVHNSFVAMQDVAIDALAVSTLDQDERGLANGVMFAGVAIGTAVGGSGMLFLMPTLGLSGCLMLVAACIAAVTVLVVIPMREQSHEMAGDRSGLNSALGKMRGFTSDALKSVVGTRGAFLAVAFAILPAGAMSLGLELASNLSVEVGMSDDDIGWLGIWSGVASATCMVAGGWLSDRYGRRKTLAIYMALTTLPVLYLMAVLLENDWIMPISAGARVAPAGVVTGLWVATLAYAVTQGLMYGTRSAIFMDVTKPAVAATQFTMYMALMNMATSYTAVWQGVAISSLGYPKTLLIDALTGVVGIALIPWLAANGKRDDDGGSASRVRTIAIVLAIGLSCWIPYRMGWAGAMTEAVSGVFDGLFTAIFLASAVFMAAAAAVQGKRVPGGKWLRWATLISTPLVLSMETRRVNSLYMTEALYVGIPVAVAAVLLVHSRRKWLELQEPV